MLFILSLVQEKIWLTNFQVLVVLVVFISIVPKWRLFINLYLIIVLPEGVTSVIKMGHLLAPIILLATTFKKAQHIKVMLNIIIYIPVS